MTELISIGNPPWSRADLEVALPQFEHLYGSRPIKDNTGGMRFPHMFATWFMAKYLSPSLIVESGIYKGQGTWLLEQACPTAKIISIDLNLSQRVYISNNVSYRDRDFSELDWSSMETHSALVFFDDHQNAYNRLQLCKWFGFRDVIFEDNYPLSQGDCYSLKKAFGSAGFEPLHSGHKSVNFLQKAVRKLGLLPSLTPQYNRSRIVPNTHDAELLRRNLEIYYEFPPVFKRDKTRWGDNWAETNYPTPKPILDSTAKADHPAPWDEATAYTWIYYARLREG